MGRSWEREVKAEAARAVSYMNDRVAPRVRRESRTAMRALAGELRRLAEKLDGHGSERV